MTVKSVREAVADGSIDQRFVEAALSVARAVVAGRPTPTGGHWWSDGDLDDLVQESVERVGTDKLVLAASEAVNDAQFVGGWMKSVLVTTLDTRARRTPSGRVIRAMDEALRSDDATRFCLEGGYWRLGSDDREPGWSEGNAMLVAAAWEVETTIIRICRDAAKTPPMAARCDIRAVCASVLDLSGPLDKVGLAEVLAQRFNVAFETRFGYLDPDDLDRARFAATPSEKSFDAIDDDLEARRMLAQLTSEERQVIELITSLEASLRHLGDTLGCTKYRAGIIKDRLVEKLRLFAASSPGDGQGAIECLLALVGQHEGLRRSTKHDGVKHGE